MSFSDSDFRHCLGRFATGVTIVTTTRQNELYGVTINSFASLSLHPPMVLFSLDKNSNIYKNFIDAKHFVVNILSEKQLNLSKLFTHPSVVDWNAIGHSIGQTGCPIIDGTIAYLECEMEKVYDGGDHSIFIGKIKDLKQISNEGPLVYFAGEYSKLK